MCFHSTSSFFCTLAELQFTATHHRADQITAYTQSVQPLFAAAALSFAAPASVMRLPLSLRARSTGGMISKRSEPRSRLLTRGLRIGMDTIISHRLTGLLQSGQSSLRQHVGEALCADVRDPIAR